MAETNITETEENIIINDQDGLPNIHETMLADSTNGDEFEDLPTSIIVTNLNDTIFTAPEKKCELENLFKIYDPEVTFQWLRSFRRLRANFRTPLAAASARVQLHQYKINDSIITCYFAQPVTPVKTSSLQPPAPYKQFLISPPASPPIDWEPRPEGEPIINHDLLAALASLTPGTAHVLHPSSLGQPSIVVHTALGASTEVGFNANDSITKITSTSCPHRS